MRSENGVQAFQSQQRYFRYVAGLSGRVGDTIRRPLMRKASSKSYIFFLFIFFLVVGAFISTRLLDPTAEPKSSSSRHTKTTSAYNIFPRKVPKTSGNTRRKIQIPFNCTAYDLTQTCPLNYPTTIQPEEDLNGRSPSKCPDYFKWIYEDLMPWAHTGITRDMVNRANKTANFKLVIVKGKAYVEVYQKSFQTRDVFTLWGILQLLRRYPGKVPDLELMFDCVDWPVVLSESYTGPNATSPPPLFRYCADDGTLDIVFPDWSFWGWPEINIKPWEALLTDLMEGNNKKKWVDREPYAYWKGNPEVAETRQDLVKCNVSDTHDWGARIYAQNWTQESREGYKKSDLANQCMHRYKIYIEGSAWSVSEKYILACDSVTLIVKPHYYDFFTRSLLPVHHYWPIRDDKKCRSIKFAVDWGNSHKTKAQEIGRTASRFIQEELKMEYVYDYMLHLLSEYAKLLQFKPSIPTNAMELCSEAMACSAEGLEKKFMMESMIKGPAETVPCKMPPPPNPSSLNAFIQQKSKSIRQVEMWETNY